LKNWILPATTELQAREPTVITCDKLINKVRDETGHDNGKSTRTVLTGLCGYATRYGAMSVNPARSVGWPPVYGWVNGGWLDPVNVVHRIKEALTEVGYGWVTSHVFRKTVGSVIDEADLPLSALADQLGNTQQVADKHYRKRRVANKASADALEGMFDDASDA
jgi:integrase